MVAVLLDNKPAAAPKQGRKMPKSMKKPAPCEDLAARLLKHGTSLSSFKAQLGDGLSMGAVCLGLAYLSRVGLKSYLASLPPAQEPGMWFYSATNAPKTESVCNSDFCTGLVLQHGRQWN